MATFIPVNDFTEQLVKGIHSFGTHQFRVALYSSAIDSTATVLTSVTPVVMTYLGNAYPAVTITSPTDSSGNTAITAGNVTITSTNDAAPTFRYYAIYNDTATSDNLIGIWDHGSTVELNNNETFTIKWSNGATEGVILNINKA